MGLYSAHVLAALEARSGRALRESFDLIAGTSIGGILGLGIALGIPARHMTDLFEKHGTSIFSCRPPPSGFIGFARDSLRFITSAKYDNMQLRASVSEIIDPEIRMKDIPVRFIAPAVNLTRGIPVTFRTPHLQNHTNSAAIPAIDVAMATSAAPTLLPIVRIGTEYFCDGAIYANTPDHIAVHEAENLIRHPIGAVSIVSIGTTTADYVFREPDSTSFGLRHWTENNLIIRMSLATQQQSAHRILQQRLGDRYIRLDAEQGTDHAPHLGLDVATPAAQYALRSMAKRTRDSLDDAPGIDSILAHKAPTPQYYPDPDDPEPDPVSTSGMTFLRKFFLSRS